ncbi:MAG: DNA mismatch repair endonuclease MutL [Clostridia bacterium]|nr:DNA mismatch repair endonuclease MutL [Clostridia bacterium]
MAKINVLPFSVANLIAAGEVVDRPASVIKELMENAIDAGATRVTVETKQGGVAFMRVSDNGSGMEPEDVPVAIKRHATSKIRDVSDLSGILTLGFRGEALAAIAAVSDLRILSRTERAQTGTLLEASGGEIRQVSECGCSKGTTVIVEHLFSNVPARLKFLKRDVTETMAILAYVEKIALSHPEIAFTLICDGSPKLETSGDGVLLHAVHAVYGRDFASRLIEMSGSYDGVDLHGFIGRPDNVKANRNLENFFINGRYTKSKTMGAALEQAYVSFCPAERFPVCILFLKLNPEKVDVNVHPAKLEVKFSNEKPVFEAVYYTVRAALEENADRPELQLGRREMSHMAQAFAPVSLPGGSLPEARQMNLNDVAKEPAADGFVRMTAEEYRNRFAPGKTGEETRSLTADRGVSAPEPASGMQVLPEPAVPPVPVVPPMPSVPPEPPVPPVPATPPAPPTGEELPVSGPAPVLPNYRIAGILFKTYILVEKEDGTALLIDQHAAHERLNFERFKAMMEQESPATQMLAVPLEVMLTSEEVGSLELYREELTQLGFSFHSGRNTLYVDGFPQGVDIRDVPGMLQEMAGRIVEGTGTPTLTRDVVFERALYQASCKASIKGGRTYAEEDIACLVEELMRLPDITVCPHGRPVAMVIRKSNLDHQFERT